MENMPKLDDTADALALAICNVQYNRYTEFTGTDKSKKGHMTKLQEVYEQAAKEDKENQKRRNEMIKKALEKDNTTEASKKLDKISKKITDLDAKINNLG